MNSWLRDVLVCPRDKNKLAESAGRLICSDGHSYPVVDGIPVMLLDEVEPTHHYITETLDDVGRNGPSLTAKTAHENEEIDAFVQDEVPHTCGNLYFPVRYNLSRYPIPELRLEPGNGKRLLDVGCNWGRWTVAAAMKGYKPVGIDPSLKALLAARNVSRQMGVSVDLVVADARYLPFADDAFDAAFSYLVLQSFGKENARIAMKEIARTLKSDADVLIQMPNKFGVRSLFQQVRRGFREGENFDIRYWTPKELREAFTTIFGPTKLKADCFFGLGVQKNDLDMLPKRYRAIVHSSELLRAASTRLPFLTNVADSLYLESTNR